jgi:hypothetical protein
MDQEGLSSLLEGEQGERLPAHVGVERDEGHADLADLDRRDGQVSVGNA